jgi:hypothetical protein
MSDIGQTEKYTARRREYDRRYNATRPDRDRSEFAPCDRCGAQRSRRGSRSGLCQQCAGSDREAARDTRRARIAELWEAGASYRAIGEALGAPWQSIQVELVRMRRDGWTVHLRGPRGVRT